MSLNISKTGILTSNDFIEKGFLVNQSSGWSYTPVRDTNNSCAGSVIVDFSDFTSLGKSLKFYIDLTLTWGDFTGSPSNTAGTFSLRFQGSNRKIATNAFAWEGSNYVTAALQSQKTPYSLITGAITGGTYHYSTAFTIPASWFNTYNGSQLSFRTDYRKGTGQIAISNVKIGFDSLINFQASFNSDYVSGGQFYEY